MSHPNSHLRAVRGRPIGALQQECGQRRPRSPEAPNQPTTPPRNPPSELTLTTKSPHSNRTIKKGKLNGDNQPVPQSSPHTRTSTEGSQTHTELPTKTSPTTNLPVAPSSAQTLLELLTAQLETVLKTVDTLLHKHSDIAQLDTSHTKQVLRCLNDRLNPGAVNLEPTLPIHHSDRTHAPTQKKTYAEATVTTTTKRPAGPPRTHHTKTGTRPIPPQRSDFGRLVVDFDNCELHQVPPNEIKDKLNNLFANFNNASVRVAGAQFSRNGNLVLTTTPAASTRQILTSDLTTATIACLREHLGISEEGSQRTRIYPADPWHRVVIHNIPLRDLQKIPGPHGSWWVQNKDSIRSDWKEYNPLSRSAAFYCTKAVRYLIPDHITEEALKAKGTVSMCIAFDNVKCAQKLIQVGAFVHGTHCRVSSYSVTVRYL